MIYRVHFLALILEGVIKHWMKGINYSRLIDWDFPVAINTSIHFQITTNQGGAYIIFRMIGTSFNSLVAGPIIGPMTRIFCFLVRWFYHFTHKNAKNKGRFEFMGVVKPGLSLGGRQYFLRERGGGGRHHLLRKKNKHRFPFFLKPISGIKSKLNVRQYVCPFCVTYSKKSHNFEWIVDTSRYSRTVQKMSNKN